MERQRFPQNGQILIHAIHLAGEMIETPDDRGFPLPGVIAREK
ncbi:MAG: hypothetical protein ABF917_12800 [Gluconobacter oxydans]